MKKYLERRKSQVIININKIQHPSIKRSHSKELKEHSKNQKGMIITKIKQKLKQQTALLQPNNQSYNTLNKHQDNHQKMISRKSSLKVIKDLHKDNNSHPKSINKEIKKSLSKSKSKKKIKKQDYPIQVINKKKIYNKADTITNLIKKQILTEKSKGKKQEKTQRKQIKNNINKTNQSTKIFKGKKELLNLIKKREQHLKNVNQNTTLQKCQSLQVSFQQINQQKQLSNIKINNNYVISTGNSINNSQNKHNSNESSTNIKLESQKNSIKKCQLSQIISVSGFNSPKQVLKNTKQNYLNNQLKSLLKQILNEQSINQSIKNKIIKVIKQQKQQIQGKFQKSSAKKIYVENKIVSEIMSEKMFNSPKNTTPKNLEKIKFQDNQSSKKKQDSVFSYQIYQIKLQENKSQNQKYKSPSKIVSSKKNQINQLSQIKQSIIFSKPVNTSFDFIQKFCLNIFDYLEQNHEKKNRFINCIKTFEKYKIVIVLKQQQIIEVSINDSYEQVPLFYFNEKFKIPNLFDQNTRQQMLDCISMNQLLQQNGFDNYLNNQIQSCFINLIFDCLTEALYDKFQSEANIKNLIRRVQITCQRKQGFQSEILKNIFANAMQSLHKWYHFFCGKQFTQQQSQVAQTALKIVNKNNIQRLINDSIKNITKQCYGHELWLCYNISQLIFMQQVQRISQLINNKQSNK